MSEFSSGQTIDRYELLRPLGEGAMGEVYLARDPQIERLLAIKTVKLATEDPDVEGRKQRLLLEAKAAGRLVHPNVVTLFDAGDHEGRLFLAFEYVDGVDLGVRMEEQPALKVGEMLRILREVAEGLDFAHQLGVIHRDIKPSNILIDKQGRAKIADFGIAKVAGQSTELTMTGTVVGSPHYMSPEQVRGETLDGRCDVFSLGVVAYELFSNQRLFAGETLTTIVYKILHQEVPALTKLRPELEGKIPKLLGLMLAKNADERLASAAEVTSALRNLERELSEALLETTPQAVAEEFEATVKIDSGTGQPVVGLPEPPTPPTSPPTPAPTVTPTPQRRTWLWWVAGVGVLALLALAVGVWSGLRWWRQSRAAIAAVEVQRPEQPTGQDLGQRDTFEEEVPASITEERSELEALETGFAIVDAEPEIGSPERATTAQPTPDRAVETRPEPIRKVASPPTHQEARKAEVVASEPVAERPQSDPAPDTVQPAVAEVSPAAPALVFDVEMNTGLTINFRVSPAEAIVKVRDVNERRGIVLGKVERYSADAKKRRGKKGRGPEAYGLPSAGDYLVTLSWEGRTKIFLLHAQRSGPSITTLTVKLD